MKWVYLVLFIAATSVTAARGQQGDDPFPYRPVCASMFLKSEYQLSGKQRACDWIQNRMFSYTSMAGAAAGAMFSQFTERSTDRGKGTTGFSTRFSENFAQSAFKSTGAYLGGMILGEDPRRDPPYLVRLTEPHPKGFWKRTGHALMMNFVSYRCVGSCLTEGDIKKVPAISRMIGSFASGFSSELWAPDRLNSPGRALRRSASAYGMTFAGGFFAEFKPELSRAGNKVITAIFGVR
jgi:hypothetical protein